MFFSIDCCCSRKINNCHEMAERKKQEELNLNKNVGNIYELNMTPSENVSDIPEYFLNLAKINQSPPQRKKISVYVNFFEDMDMDSPLTPRTPDVNDNMINLSIPKGSKIYVNYQKYDCN